MTVNFSCLKLGTGEQLIYAGFGSKWLICKKTIIMGRKGCKMRYCKTQILGTFKLPSIFPLFSVFQKEWMKWNIAECNPYKNKVYPNIVMYIAALIKNYIRVWNHLIGNWQHLNWHRKRCAWSIFSSKDAALARNTHKLKPILYVCHISTICSVNRSVLVIMSLGFHFGSIHLEEAMT